MKQVANVCAKWQESKKWHGMASLMMHGGRMCVRCSCTWMRASGVKNMVENGGVGQAVCLFTAG